MKKIITIFLMCLACQVYAGDSARMLFTSQDFYTLTSDTSAWIKISNHEKVAFFIDIDTDSTYWLTAIGDSLVAFVKYEMYYGSSAPSTTSNGFYQDGQTAPITVLTLTDVDTTNGGRLVKVISPDPGAWIRAIVTKSTGHVLLPDKIEYTLGIWLDEK